MFDLIFENDHFVVVSKHANVSVHRDNEDLGFVTEVEQRLGVTKLYLVHRLDKMTSGLLLLAKSSSDAATLSGLFAQREVEKFYLAISDKKPKKKQGLISGDMERSRRSSWKLKASQDNPAKTQFISASAGAGKRMFLCKPYTGKTHQIRVALKSIGSPIVGDAIYYTASQSDRGYLHAYALEFEFNEKQYQFICNPCESAIYGQLWQEVEIQNQLANWAAPFQIQWPTIKGIKK
jgi:tRNA pseudouridine32 synthase/23S rRNA pseudouridine746 synthase